ncbi:efflux RND transporter periplasmic adaptor subunit [Microvirga arsenatis]|uniref:Efflux RND transporter periplasmic adaptor subunit n=1 Tax=Microvirga arsenatis TaxID=2692265 RepID=A0ABW9YTM8_9HYPH|nr:efflux RND transporter periplasmic adaptor subunit [Microvirga arsenatis]NBJ09434.1 efflux RND transporter periplasmic adaptor subunit [Microvirga arsenatis]NBJ23708.1 efflux RND transporter periplasmic adaptor subunit [Microvirga arsenatis]
MSRAAWIAGTLAALAAGGGGYWAGQGKIGLPAIDVPALVSTARTHLGLEQPAAAPSSAPAQAGTGPVIYYRDPDGKPFYSLEPKRTTDGRDYRPVRASEDVSFEDELVQAAGTPAPAAQGDRRVLYYRNPMGLPDTSPVPKKDSMGMDYIPVYEGEDDGSTVTVSPGKLQRTGVRSEVVELRRLELPVRSPGTLVEDERRISVVSVRSESFIEKVENVTTGDHVRRGEPLLRLYSPEIAAAGAQYLSTVMDGGAQSGGRLVLDGARRRLENLGVSAEVLAEIERTRRVPLTIPWTAPRDGVVVERSVSDGMRAMAGDVLFRIVDHSVMWVLADVTERELALIREGQSATVRVRGFPGREFTGTVARIYPHLATETRTARIRIELANPNGILRPAMYADVEFAAGSQDAVVAVPDSAVIDTGTRQVVILDKGDGKFEPREVKAGVRGAGYTEIKEGVADGDRVVVTANFLIDAESNLKAALQGMATSEATP